MTTTPTIAIYVSAKKTGFIVLKGEKEAVKVPGFAYDAAGDLFYLATDKINSGRALLAAVDAGWAVLMQDRKTPLPAAAIAQTRAALGG